MIIRLKQAKPELVYLILSKKVYLQIWSNSICLKKVKYFRKFNQIHYMYQMNIKKFINNHKKVKLFLTVHIFHFSQKNQKKKGYKMINNLKVRTLSKLLYECPVLINQKEKSFLKIMQQLVKNQ